MLEPPDEVLDEPCADLSPGEREGRGAAERTLGRGEPAAGRPVASSPSKSSSARPKTRDARSSLSDSSGRSLPSLLRR